MGVDFSVMIGLTALVLAFAWRRPHAIRRWQATVLLTAYVAYIGYLISQGMA